MKTYIIIYQDGSTEEVHSIPLPKLGLPTEVVAIIENGQESFAMCKLWDRLNPERVMQPLVVKPSNTLRVRVDKCSRSALKYEEAIGKKYTVIQPENNSMCWEVADEDSSFHGFFLLKEDCTKLLNH